MTLAYAISGNAQRCFRCGYDLLGIADEQPCPECGLLAVRSRRPSDELHLARPRWLRRLSLGVWLILLAMIWPVVWALIGGTVFGWLDEMLEGLRWQMYALASRRLPLHVRLIFILAGHQELGLAVGTTLLWIGAACLAGREGFEAADRSDRLRRKGLLICSFWPTLAVFFRLLNPTQRMLGQPPLPWSFQSNSGVLSALATLICIPLPMLLFFQLRSLAKRARSASLAEHCAIVGIGTSAALAYATLLFLLIQNAEAFGLKEHWLDVGNFSMTLLLIISVAGTLFYGWAGVLLIRFAVSFARASRQMRHDWKLDDRAASVG